jgi:arylformamidase
MLIWPGNAGVSLTPVKSISEGSSSNLSRLEIGTHTGTHVDAPRHFSEGAPGVDAIDPAVLVGPARLFRLPDVEHIDRTLLDTLNLNGVTRVLFATRNSALLRRPEFESGFVYLSDDAAAHLVGLGIRLVGIDYLSIEKYKAEGHRTHRTLLEAGVVIVEGLELSNVPEGDYELMCLPIKIQDADGAPARVLLRELR